MKNILLAIAALGMVAHAPAGAWAAEAEPAKEWDPVVVTASRVPEKLANVTAAMTVIPQEEIRKNRYQSLNGLLRNYGVSVNDYGPNQGLTQLALRGHRNGLFGENMQDSVLVLLDGRRIGTSNLSMLPMANIERVEILRGPAAVQYGAAGVGGVINVITRRGGEEFHAGAEAGLGSFSQWHTQGYISGMAGPFDFAVGGQYGGAANYNIGGDSYKLYDNTAVGYTRGISANLGFNFFEQHRLGVTYTSMEIGHAGNPGYFSNPDILPYTNRANTSIDLLYEGGHKDWGLSWMGRYFNGEADYFSSFDPNNPGMTSWPYWQSHIHHEGAQAQLSWTNGMFTLTGGADWNRQTLTQADTYGLDWLTFTNTWTYGDRSTYNMLGLFLLGKLSLFDDRLIISAGLRNDDYILEFNDKSNDLHNLSPTVGIAWHATDWLTLKANYGVAYKLPTPYQFVGGPGWVTTLPNHDLRPEKSYGLDAGVEIHYRGLRAGLSYFQSVTTDNVTPVAVGWAQRYENSDGVLWLKGLEGNASVDFGEFFEWPFALRPYVNFTHLFERKMTDDVKPLYVTDWDLACGVNFNHPGWGTDIDLRLTYFGHQFVRDWELNSPTNGQIVRIGGKTTVDAFLTQRVWENEKVGTFSLQASVRNIFNEKYALQKGYPMPGRSVYVGVKWEF